MWAAKTRARVCHKPLPPPASGNRRPPRKNGRVEVSVVSDMPSDHGSVDALIDEELSRLVAEPSSSHHSHKVAAVRIAAQRPTPHAEPEPEAGLFVYLDGVDGLDGELEAMIEAELQQFEVQEHKRRDEAARPSSEKRHKGSSGELHEGGGGGGPRAAAGHQLSYYSADELAALIESTPHLARLPSAPASPAVALI